MSIILNLTQHEATPAQLEEGVFEPTPELKEEIRGLLTFDDIPSTREMFRRARGLAQAVAHSECSMAMIGGAPFFMSTLESELLGSGISPLYAFSRRESVDELQEDGSLVKRAKFVHLGFVGASGTDKVGGLGG